MKRKQIAFVGLGKMGKHMVLRLLERGWDVSVYDKDPHRGTILARRGARPAASLKELVAGLKPPRLVWLMLPFGKPVEEVIFGREGLVHLLKRDDTIIDGGNSFFRNSITRAEKLKKKGMRFIDVGVSGGPQGARRGACLMIGGEKRNFERHRSLFRDLATRGGFQFFEGQGAGHFVKMIHNGIEYGMMEAIGEGFAILKKSPYRLDLKKVATLYNHGSVIESRLMGWLRKAFEKHGQELRAVSGKVSHTGEGEWAIRTARRWGIPASVMREAFRVRLRSWQRPSYAGKVVSALRGQFGGHKVVKEQP